MNRSAAAAVSATVAVWIENLWKKTGSGSGGAAQVLEVRFEGSSCSRLLEKKTRGSVAAIAGHQRERGTRCGLRCLALTSDSDCPRHCDPGCFALIRT